MQQKQLKLSKILTSLRRLNNKSCLMINVTKVSVTSLRRLNNQISLMINEAKGVIIRLSPNIEAKQCYKKIIILPQGIYISTLQNILH